MNVNTRNAAVVLAAVLLAGGCATKGMVRQAIADQQAALQTEKAERIAADSGLSSNVAQLRTDLTAMQKDFNAKIAVVEEGIRFDVPVHFAFDSSDIRPEDTAVLDRFASIASKYYAGATVTVEGFADPAGSVSYNQRLSQRRADAVEQYLQGKQLASPMRSVGYGKTRLVVPGAKKDDQGAELNRRVVFVIETPATGSAMAALDN